MRGGGKNCHSEFRLSMLQQVAAGVVNHYRSINEEVKNMDHVADGIDAATWDDDVILLFSLYRSFLLHLFPNSY
jgi:hypothetical protein